MGVAVRLLSALLLMGGVAAGTVWGVGDPHAIDLSSRLAAPSWVHPLGTDHLGRDLAARIVWGAFPSLFAVGLVLAGGLGLGLLAGGAMALGSPAVRRSVHWLANTALAIPTLVMALVLSAVLGASVVTVAAALLVTSWAPYAVTIAALFDRIRGEGYWRASQALGVDRLGAVRRHMLPTAWPALGALAGADAGRAVIVVASLGFIGVSADTGRPEWGTMIHEYRMFLFTEPRLVLAPVVACTFVCIALHGLLDGGGSRTYRHSVSKVRATPHRG